MVMKSIRKSVGISESGAVLAKNVCDLQLFHCTKYMLMAAVVRFELIFF